MRLSDIDIRKHITAGDIMIDPMPTEECFGSFSVDVRLGNQFQIFQPSQLPYLDLSDPRGMFAVSENMMKEVRLEANELFYLHPGEFALGTTLERVKIGNSIVGWLDGRSSLARVGLMVHITAHAVDPGWDGCITFEFFNAGRLPLALKPGIRIGALSFEQLSTPSGKPYGHKSDAKYFKQNKPLVSRFNSDS